MEENKQKRQELDKALKVMNLVLNGDKFNGKDNQKKRILKHDQKLK